MALINARLGARVMSSIGRHGEKPDAYAGRIASHPIVTMTPRGPVKTATLIEYRQNQEGEWFLGEREANLLYSRDRTETVEALDGSEQEPKSVVQLIAERAEALDAFLASRAQEADISELV